MANSFSTNTTLTVQVPEGYSLPTTGGIGTVSYSTQKTPYGFPGARGKWRISSFKNTDNVTTSNATYGSYMSGGWAITVPVGEWTVGWQAGGIYNNTTTSLWFNLSKTSLTGLTQSTGYTASEGLAQRIQSPSAASLVISGSVSLPQLLSVASTYTLQTIGATTNAGIDGSSAIAELFAENGYL